MGGSFAKALRALPDDYRILALDKNPAALERARADGLIDGGFAPQDAPAMLAQCDIVFVCLYPQDSIAFLTRQKSFFKTGAIVTEIAGVKREIVNHLSDILRDDVDFICGHPMAGSEKEGLPHSGAGIFKDKIYIIMPLPSNKRENIEFFKALIRKIGFARVTETNCAVHDHKIAFTSQLCHVIASALVDSAEDTRITEFGGGSYEDLTRIAMINAPLWTELFLANKKELIFHITAFENSIQKIKQFIQENNAPALNAALQNVREKRIAMSKREASAQEA
jgi:prephenate dehydrogenase